MPRPCPRGVHEFLRFRCSGEDFRAVFDILGRISAPFSISRGGFFDIPGRILRYSGEDFRYSGEDLSIFRGGFFDIPGRTFDIPGRVFRYPGEGFSIFRGGNFP